MKTTCQGGFPRKCAVTFASALRLSAVPTADWRYCGVTSIPRRLTRMWTHLDRVGGGGQVKGAHRVPVPSPPSLSLCLATLLLPSRPHPAETSRLHSPPHGLLLRYRRVPAPARQAHHQGPGPHAPREARRRAHPPQQLPPAQGGDGDPRRGTGRIHKRGAPRHPLRCDPVTVMRTPLVGSP